MTSPPTVNEVRYTYSGTFSGGDNVIQSLLDRAERLRDDKFSDRIRSQGELEGDQNDFHLYLTLHLMQLTEGGESQSESQTGGSVNYSHLQGNIEQSLTETRWGRLCMTYLENDGASIGVEIT